MNQLTIRGFDKDIEREIREIARKEKVSLNKAVLRILQHGLGSADRHVRSRTIGSTLDHLAGNWSEDEARAMDEVEKDFEQIDLVESLENLALQMIESGSEPIASRST